MSDDGQDDTEGAIEAIELRRDRWIIGLAASPLAVAAALTTGMALGWDRGLLCITLLFAMLGIATSYYGWRRNPFPRRVPVRLRADRVGLTIDEVGGGPSRRVAAKSMLRGVRTAGPVAAVLVRITRRWASSLVFEVSATLDPPLLTRLGLDVRQTTASFRAMSRMHAGPWTMAGAATVAALTSAAALFGTIQLTPWCALIIPIAALTPLVLSLIPSRVEVGADGVLIRWLATRHFIGHADISGTSMGPESRGHQGAMTVVTITQRGAAQFVIPIAGPERWSDDAEQLCARIMDARNAWESGHAGAPMPLLRGERDHALWVAALRKQEAADLRSTAVPRAELWRVVEDLGGAPIHRAAAALALGRGLGDADRERLERAAKTTVAPKLRVVLERAAIADDEELAQRLQTLERE
jgi:hypothetical protein